MELCRWNESHPLSDDSVRYLRRGYFAATSFMDAQMGLVLDALDAAGPAVADNTVTVLCELPSPAHPCIAAQAAGFGLFRTGSDHGWHLGDSNAWAKGANYE